MATPIIQLGLGPIGQGIVRHILARRDYDVVGAVDPAPDKAGRSLAEVVGLEAGAPGADAARSVTVRASLDEALAAASVAPVLAIHTTSSFLSQVTPQLVEAADRGLNVVSTCEELSYPFHHHPDQARAIDEAARRAGVSVLGTGVNPGFVMDLLPVCLTGVAASVLSVHVDRVVDAGTRRGPLKKKVGAGISLEEFHRRAASGTFGHIGLVESVAMVGAALGWTLTRITSDLRPKVAEEPYESPDVRVAPGDVLGIDQVAAGVDPTGAERIRFHLQMYVGAPDPHDTVRLEGNPPLELTIPRGTPGDVATMAAVINAIPQVIEAAPGLRTVVDLPVPRWRRP
ncbi:NAD(P)H-dependent amine dehydrogenase family protein [Limnochorda pilosa]|uniref:Dihydrodipicolinate reductase n=1 Tax=Limnochorda pilosa TaxID=1555112 RepID=A0A0K2SN94_LIMPI|nr:hypothetical protein [Limnochorda pilosa]BAS28581.1 dihydrodipicolinate reductase [Limnochorda pilosa]